MQLILFLSVLLAFASRGFGLNIVLGAKNLTAAEFLDVEFPAECQPICGPGATSMIQACMDDNCLCTSSTVSAIRDCQQCMFEYLIEKNQKAPDLRFGSSSALSAYQAACLASVNVTIPASEIKLVVPSNWAGPSSMELGTGATVLAVSTAAVLAMGGFYLINTM